MKKKAKKSEPSQEFKEKAKLTKLYEELERKKHQWKMEELEFQRETDRIKTVEIERIKNQKFYSR